MTKEFCDLCGHEVNSYYGATEYQLKVRARRLFLFHESEWHRVVLCDDCRRSFYSYYKANEKKN